MSLIQVRNLVKNYHILDKEFKILDHLDLDVEEGEIVSVEGKSGIGKSTLLNILGSMDSSDAGEVSVCGVSLDQISETGKKNLELKRLPLSFSTIFCFRILPRLKT